MTTAGWESPGLENQSYSDLFSLEGEDWEGEKLLLSHPDALEETKDFSLPETRP